MGMDNNKILYTSVNGIIFMYDFMQKQLLNTIDLSVINTLTAVNCVNFAFDSITKQQFVCFAKRPNPKEIHSEMVYLLNITEYIQEIIMNDVDINDTLKQNILFLNSETNTFEYFNDEETLKNSRHLKLFKQIQCVSFSPNMQFLAVSCGLSIDFFHCQQSLCSERYEFTYIDFHNYGASVQSVDWLNKNTLIVMSKNALIMTRIQLKKQDYIIGIINDICPLTEDIMDVMLEYLKKWDITHDILRLSPKCNDVEPSKCILKCCIDDKAIIFYPELRVSLVD